MTAFYRNRKILRDSLTPHKKLLIWNEHPNFNEEKGQYIRKKKKRIINQPSSFT